MTHHCQDLILLFNELFEKTENTILIGGAEEPLYLPCDNDSPFSRVIFTRDYFSSALHEIAHWCMASDERRKQVDYGYWYFPEGRSEEQQMLFEKAGVKPQALELIFSEAAGSTFSVSQDNLVTGYGCTATFKKNVIEQASRYLAEGLPPRAALFRDRLIKFYERAKPMTRLVIKRGLAKVI